MFLHLGENVVVPIKDVIGIFDIHNSMYSSDTISFLRMAEEDENVFVPQQFANENNTNAHKYHTALEILEQTAGKIDGFCSGIGTGGTITGIGETLKSQYPDIEIWAVEPEHAAILAGGTIGTHLQMGIGDGIIPDILFCLCHYTT